MLELKDVIELLVLLGGALITSTLVYAGMKHQIGELRKEVVLMRTQMRSNHDTAEKIRNQINDSLSTIIRDHAALKQEVAGLRDRLAHIENRMGKYPR